MCDLYIRLLLSGCVSLVIGLLMYAFIMFYAPDTKFLSNKLRFVLLFGEIVCLSSLLFFFPHQYVSYSFVVGLLLSALISGNDRSVGILERIIVLVAVALVFGLFSVLILPILTAAVCFDLGDDA